ncbi:sensor histidine kinase [Pseudooceanicola sp. CBS1P-1]|nr:MULTISPECIES: sensor histidine kinase [Pseudooceanicola]MBT9386036.1 sensor histidine kinase [Pseudooceanicola endophyticus]
MRPTPVADIRPPVLSGTVLPPLTVPDRAAEADHRIANSLQMLSALITRELRDPGAGERGALLRTQGRILAIAEMHRLLHHAGAEPEAAAYLGRLCGAFARLLPAHRPLRLEAEPARMAPSALTAAGILVSELVMNAAKHAYDPRTPGEIVIRLRARQGRLLRLEVEDHGPRAHPPETGRGLGLALIEATCRELGGTPAWENARPGLRFVLRMPMMAR